MSIMDLLAAAMAKAQVSGQTLVPALAQATLRALSTVPALLQAMSMIRLSKN